MRKEVRILFVIFSLIIFIHFISGNSNFQQYLSNTLQRTSQNLLTEQFLGQPEFEGYIIQLKEEPLIVKERKLRIVAEKNSIGTRNVLANIFAFILPTALEPTLPSNIQDKIQIHTNDLQQEHQNFKSKALQRINQRNQGIFNPFLSLITGKVVSNEQLSVLGEYEKVFNGIVLNITTEEANSLKELNEVEEVYPNYKMYATLTDSISLINADDVWQLDVNGNNCATSGQNCLTGQGITIGIIDTGVDYTHPDLGGCIQTTNINDGSCSKVIGGYDFVNNDNDPMDDMGHGTHVAATAAGNGILKGVAPGANIVAYKVLDQEGSGWQGDIIAAIERSVDPNQDNDFSDHLDIISLSLGGYGNPDDPPSQAIDNAVDSGVVAVIAAGNLGPKPGTIGSPGTARKAITVGASDKLDSIAYFSSRGPVVWKDVNMDTKYLIKPDLVAPGVSICAAQWDNAFSNADTNCNDDNSHVAISGTSMATPHVAGAVALLLQKNPSWTSIEIKMNLRNKAVDLSYEINTQGYGRADVLELVNSNKPVIAILDNGQEVDGVLDIYGAALGESFSDYSLYYGEELDPMTWNEIYSSTIPINGGVLYSGFDTNLLSEGENILKLVVRNTNGEESEDRNILNVNNVEITNPLNNDVLRLGDVINIDGTILGTNDYLFEYETSFDSDIWSSDGFTMIDDGEVLATFDTNVLPGSGFYTIRIIVNYGNKQVYEYIQDIYFDSTLKQGWPVKIEDELVELFNPIIEDLDNDGNNEIIFGSASSVYHSPQSKIYIFNSDGTNFKNWPKGFNTPGIYPSIGDINLDGNKEIIASAHPGKLYILDIEGNIINNWEVPNGLLGGPSLGDLDRDGDLEIIVGFFNLDNSAGIYAWNNDGSMVDGWPVQISEGSQTHPFIAPAIGDIDNDGFLEISMTTFLSSNVPKVYVFNHDGSVADGWPIEVTGSDLGFDFSPSIADIDNDGFFEVIALGRNLGSGVIFIWDYVGNMLTGWPKSIPSWSSVSIGNIDTDNELEIFSYTYSYNHDGSIVNGWPIKRENSEFLPYSRFSPIIGDINGDSKQEIIIGYNKYIYLMDNQGKNVPGWPKKVKSQIDSSFAIGDLENDGYLDLITIDIENRIYVYEFQNTYSPKIMDWPMFQHDPQHTSCYNCPQIEVYTETPPTTPVETPSTNPECIDTDEGIDSYIRGTVIRESFSDYTDYCQNMETFQPWNYCDGENCGVREFYCEMDSFRFTNIGCTKGCIDGKCVTQTEFEEATGKIDKECIDEDGGEEYFIYGTITGLESSDLSIQSIWFDYCGMAGDEENKLVEYICKDNGAVEKILYECPNECLNGACI